MNDVESVISELKETLGPKGQLTDVQIATRPAWMGNGGEDSAPAVLRPANVAELVAALRICHARGQAVGGFQVEPGLLGVEDEPPVDGQKPRRLHEYAAKCS